MITMCQFLGVTIVAEGIEKRSQLEWLKKQACDEYQGFYFCPPVEAHEMISLTALREVLSAENRLVAFDH
jgi:EAL domain-containing protein (putative c-di-GMP-specific phosphodiesterase class I)